MRTPNRIGAAFILSACAGLLAACSGGDSPAPAVTPPPPVPTTASFDVTLVNLTAGQPLTPMVAVAHSDTFSLFKLGEEASVALEHLAESGDTSAMVAAVNDSKSVAASAVGTGGPLLPGPGNKSTVTLTVPLGSLPTLRLSLAAMLGNTNDGFTGVSAKSIAALAVGATVTERLIAYDAGTEANSESADTVPGPATAGSGGKREGFNPTRDDVINTVHVHPGLVSKDDGLPTSALNQLHRWDNPVAVLTIKRTQ